MSITRYKQAFTLMEALGLLTVTWYAKLTSGGYMPLTVELISAPVEGEEYDLSLCHYGEQNGDLMRDPEMVIRVYPATRVAIPIYFRNDYAGVEQSDEILGLPNTVEFLITWLQNLTDQGFVCRGDTDTEGNLLAQDLSAVPTCRLVEELVKREGVTEYGVGVEDRYLLQIAYPETKGCGETCDTGPVRILVVID